jgi:ParB family chromosome partitioning protein
VIQLTDEEAQDLQFAENIHRKNLTQLEEAKAIQHDLAKLGSVELVLQKYRKSRAWLSKRLALLQLPEQAMRLMAENISADLEVINMVKTIERANPAAAHKLVDQLKENKYAASGARAREMAKAVKEQSTPTKKPKVADGAGVATPKDRRHEAPGSVDTFSHAKTKVPDDQGKGGADWAYAHFCAGQQTKDAGRALIQGLRDGTFSSEGVTAAALVAFVRGAGGKTAFDFDDVLVSAGTV